MPHQRSPRHLAPQLEGELRGERDAREDERHTAAEQLALAQKMARMEIGVKETVIETLKCGGRGGAVRCGDPLPLTHLALPVSFMIFACQAREAAARTKGAPRWFLWFSLSGLRGGGVA